MHKNRSQVTSKLNDWNDWLFNHVSKPIKDKTSRVFKTFKDKVMGLYNMPGSRDTDIFEQQEMCKNRSQVTSKLNDWNNWLVNHVPKPIKDKTSRVFKTFKDKVMGLYNMPDSRDMDIFEQQEMCKNRSQVMSKLNDWNDWLVNHVPKPIKDKTSRVFKTFKDKVMGLYNRVKGENTDNELMPGSRDMDIFEQQEMCKNRSQVMSKLNDWNDWLVNHVPKPIKDKTSRVFDLSGKASCRSVSQNFV